MLLRRLTSFSSALPAIGFGVAILACEGTPAARRADSPAIAPADSGSRAAVSRVKGSGWNEAAGSYLLVQGESPEEAVVLVPDDESGTGAEPAPSAMSGANAVLFGRGGSQLSAQMGAQPRETDPGCRLWPLHNVQGSSESTPWAVGFISTRIVPLPLDSIDGLSSRDSMSLAAEAARLASSVTAITDPAFQGLRFTAHDIRRFEVTPGVQAIVAHLIRRVNQEANPQQEQTLVIAERDSGTTSGPYQLVYAERTHGLEEQVATPEVLAAVTIAGKPTLIVAKDSDDGVSYVMLERAGARQWRVGWASALTHCR